MKRKIFAMFMAFAMTFGMLSTTGLACATYKNCPKCGSTSYSQTIEQRKSCKKKTSWGLFSGKETYWQEEGHISHKCSGTVKFLWWNKTCGKQYLVKCDKSSKARHYTKGDHVYINQKY